MMPYQKTISLLTKCFPAMISGLLLTLCFPDTGWYFLAFFALVPWLISTQTLTLKETMYSGFSMGMAHYLTLIYWIVPTVHTYGKLHIIFALATLILFCCYLSLYPALFAFLMKKLPKQNHLTPLWGAFAWTGLELLRTYAFTGFPWGALGYSQFSNHVLIQIADFSGVYGVSFILIFVNYSFALAWHVYKKKLSRTCLFCFLYSSIFLSGVIYYGQHQIKAVLTEMETTSTTLVAVVQGNIEQDDKWSKAFKNKTIDKYTRLSESVFSKKPDLIIWPETALPFYYTYDQKLSSQVDQSVRNSKTNFLIGSPAFERNENQIKFYNRAYMLNRFSIVTGTYDKTHLVPFGEYVPLGEYLPFLGKITVHAGNFSSGDKRFSPLTFNNQTQKVTSKIGVLICFDILFPSISASFVKNGATMLTTLTNDAWFGFTSAAAQHFSFAVFRAVENRRSVARAANTGISGFIDPVGNIFKPTDLYTDQVITKRIPLLNRISFYTRYGDLFAIGCAVAFCLVFMVKGVRKKV